ncbi:MAG: CYTH domain-containing protein [Eubacteriales bacterium]|nr:CYTH domain-containing protein [Eubacteriales bacterium]
MEIEKKFQLKALPDLSGYQKKEIEQGYLCTDPVVRIRKSDDQYILTYKSKVGIEPSGIVAQVNQEMEVPLHEKAYQHLREKVDNHLIRKSRYVIPLADGHTGELDVFHGVLEGLAFIEVEFESEEAASAFCPPEWFGDNVSMDKRYTNSFLSKCEDLTVFPKETK